MKKFISTLLLVCVWATVAVARPAAPGVTTVKNSDGSSLSFLKFGDEHYHFLETVDGFLITEDAKNGYVYVDEQGIATEIVAKNAAYRTDLEKAFLTGLDQNTVHQNYRKMHGNRFPEDLLSDEPNFLHSPLMAYNQNGVSALQKRPKADKWTSGERWFPVVLAGTTDKPHGDSAEFYDFFNKPGYSENNNIGSLRDYFLHASGGLFNPHFDIYPVDINATLTSFGRGSNYSEGKLIAAGLDELGKRADFKENAQKYCFQNTNVNGFIYLFPGTEEDAMRQSENFWGHAFMMSYNGSSPNKSAYSAGGVLFEKYVFLAQFQDNSNNTRITNMGSFAHEFSHVMGLKDHYFKDENGKQINGPGYFDLMSQGLYNGQSINSGDAPMGYSAFEKEWMGWLTLEELQPDSVYSLKKLSEMQAYSITNPNYSDEYYIVEYRPPEKYDAYVRADWGQTTNGIYVWYIDFDQTIFVDERAANADINHQRLALNTVLEKNGYYADFTYVNKGGVSPVSGIYNVVLDGNDRACFTTSNGISLTACPEQSSSSEASSSSESSPESSSSKDTSKAAVSVSDFAVSQVHLSLNGRMLNVFVNIEGIKEIRIFDMQGHLLRSQKFAEKSTELSLEKISRGTHIVRLSVGGKVIAVKKL